MKCYYGPHFTGGETEPQRLWIGYSQIKGVLKSPGVPVRNARTPVIGAYWALISCESKHANQYLRRVLAPGRLSSPLSEGREPGLITAVRIKGKETERRSAAWPWPGRLGETEESAEPAEEGGQLPGNEEQRRWQPRTVSPKEEERGRREETRFTFGVYLEKSLPKNAPVS